MYRPIQLLSKNKKTGVSIDLPIAGHCRPTRNCAHDCYAKQGHQSRPPAKRKQIYLSEYLAGPDQSGLIYECSAHTSVRISGSGDLLPCHVPNLINLAKTCHNTQFWGMTRKPEIAEAINNKLPNLRMLLTVDASSPKSVWSYQGAMCYGPRRPENQVPEDDRIKVVFPRHHGGRVIKGVPRHPKDCLSVWHELSGCHACGRCWKW